jgi:hypothetical protein
MKIISLQFLFFILASTVLFYSCSKNATKEEQMPVQSSFEALQSKILTPSCATSGCHASEKDNFFAQHGLVLAEGNAYQNLVNVRSKNDVARSQGMMRIKPSKPDESLFFQKINGCFGAQKFGSLMPLGGKPLSFGQLEFIRLWIEAGAPEKGVVADAAMLEQMTVCSSSTTIFEAIPAPAVGEGFQIKTDKFSVNTNFEREIFVRRAIGNTQPIYINRYQFRSRPNSHHLVIYGFRDQRNLPANDQMRDLRNPDNSLNLNTYLTMQNHVFLGGGTDTNIDYSFPDGTALEVPAGATVDLNAHYFNKTNEILAGENIVNLYTMDKAKVKKIVRTIDFNNTDLTLQPNVRTTIKKTFKFNANASVVMLTSHNHKYGEKFVIRIAGGARDGEIVYESTNWEHPLVKNFGEPLVLAKGEGLTSEVTYMNTSNRAIRFGLTSEDEMNIIFGYYYEN